MGMKIHGIGSSQLVDSSGEILDIKGHDISFLAGRGVFNFEHESKNASQIVGKILYAKKIFNEQDCENEHQLKFWKRVQAPYVYVMGELFDDVGHSGAQDIAALALYDKRMMEAGLIDFKTVWPLMGFSVEGSKINKEGNVITHSLARKITITLVPCNKSAWAEILPEEAVQEVRKSDRRSEAKKILEKMLTKSEGASEVQLSLIQSEINALEKSEELEKADDEITTRSGKKIPFQWHAPSYKDFSPDDHRDAMNAHYNAAMATKDPQSKRHHMMMTQRHQQGMMSARPTGAPKVTTKAPAAYVKPQLKEKKYTEVVGGGIPANQPKKMAASEMEKAIHHETSAKGVSDMGIEARRGDTRNKGAISHSFGRVTDPKTHMENAKKMARLKLDSIKREPKPSLPKSEIKKALTATASPLNPEILDKKMYKSEGGKVETIDMSIPTWNTVELFKKWIAERMPTLTKKEVNAVTRAFKIFKIKKASNNLKDM